LKYVDRFLPVESSVTEEESWVSLKLRAPSKFFLDEKKMRESLVAFQDSSLHFIESSSTYKTFVLLTPRLKINEDENVFSHRKKALQYIDKFLIVE